MSVRLMRHNGKRWRRYETFIIALSKARTRDEIRAAYDHKEPTVSDDDLKAMYERCQRLELTISADIHPPDKRRRKQYAARLRQRVAELLEAEL